MTDDKHGAVSFLFFVIIKILNRIKTKVKLFQCLKLKTRVQLISLVFQPVLSLNLSGSSMTPYLWFEKLLQFILFLKGCLWNILTNVETFSRNQHGINMLYIAKYKMLAPFLKNWLEKTPWQTSFQRSFHNTCHNIQISYQDIQLQASYFCIP